MKTLQSTLITELSTKTKEALAHTELLLDQNLETLNKRPSEQAWSALECIQHLNFYHDFYLPEFEKINENGKAQKHPEFKSSFLGEYFANGMKYEAKPMKTLKSTNPIGSSLDKKCLTKFHQELERLHNILGAATHKDLGKNKCGISISKLIRLKYGDALRVVIYHNERHLMQALKASGLRN